MEGSPTIPDQDSEKKESKQKKRKAEALGAFIVEPKESKKKTDVVNPDSLWEKQPPESKENPADVNPDAFLAESAAMPESEAPLEELGELETGFIERSIVQAERAQEAETEHAGESGEEPNRAVERFRDKIVSEQLDSETAFQQTMEELAIPVETPDEPGGVESPDPPVIESYHDLPETPVSLSSSNEEQEPGSDVTRHTGSSSSVSQPPALGGVGSGGTRGGGRSGGGGGSNFQYGPNQPFGGQYNAAPNQASAATRTEYIPVPDQRSVLGPALFGGVIGYLIGRRRGRIKTEKRLLPIQKKLENQVKNLESNIASKEATIRQAAIEKMRENKWRTKGAKHAGEAAIPLAYGRTENRRVAPRAHELHGKEASSEKIGKVLVDAEAQTRAPEKQPEESPEITKLKIENKSIQTLNRAELLSMSEKIIVDGSSLRQIYETHLVGERGLRRLIETHLAGGDIKKALRREVVEREIDFERDPVMRDRAAQVSGGGTSTTSLTSLLKKADVSLDNDTEEVAFLKARAAYEAAEQEKSGGRRHLLDVTLISTIAVLAAIIALLVLKR